MPLRTTSPVPEPQRDAALFAWHEVETEEDIALLQKTACGFHDAVIRRMKLETGCRYVPGEGMYQQCRKDWISEACRYPTSLHRRCNGGS